MTISDVNRYLSGYFTDVLIICHIHLPFTEEHTVCELELDSINPYATFSSTEENEYTQPEYNLTALEKARIRRKVIVLLIPDLMVRKATAIKKLNTILRV